MKKNGLLTFLFACIPGAGQMYYGYMLRGLSMISLFCLGFALSTVIGAFALTLPVIWMFSFFDTYDLIRHLVAGDAKPDAFPLADSADLRSLLPSHHKLIGWAFIGLGVWALYKSIFQNLAANLLSRLVGPDAAWNIIGTIPSVVVAVLLVAVGVKLLGLHAPAAKVPDFDFPPYTPTAPGPQAEDTAPDKTIPAEEASAQDEADHL